MFDGIKKLFGGKEENISEEKQGLAPAEDTAALPPKPPFKVEEEYGGIRCSFELSGDFIEFNSHCEFDPSYIYKPLSEEEYECYEPETPIIAIGPSDTMFFAIDMFENGDEPDIPVTPLSNEYFLFKCKFTEYDYICYAYAFRSGTAWETLMFCLQYPPALEGTALEQKLIAIMDRAAESYREYH